MVNVEPIDSAQQPISDDAELAKVLAGIDQQTEEASVDQPTPVMPAPTTDDTSLPVVDDMPAIDSLIAPPVVAPEPVAAPVEAIPAPEITMPAVVEPAVVEVAPIAAPAMMPAGTGGDLDAVKQDALNELRPLVDKLNVSPEEKFDTYLLLLRSTDDRNLIAPAHEAAKAITDEARRAQALLDIIKEIDFLSQPQQQ